MKKESTRIVEFIYDGHPVRIMQVKRKFLFISYWKNIRPEGETIINALVKVREDLLNKCKQGYLRESDLSDFAQGYIQNNIRIVLNNLITEIMKGTYK